MAGRGEESESAAGEEDRGRGWMREFQRGDERAFEEIVRFYEGPVRHYLVRYVRDRSRIEDLTQEVFLRVYRSKDRYEPTATFKTWLFTIATRLALNEIRGLKRRRRVFADQAPAEDGAPMACATAEDRDRASPSERLELSELEELVDRLVSELPEQQRTALILSRGEGWSYQQISEVLGGSTMAVKSLLMRARQTLRRRLAPYLTAGRNTI